MRIFITGATGWIGSALVGDLLARGHDVVGLARSHASEERLHTMGARSVRGDMTDHDRIVEQVRLADATAHLAFTLDFGAFEETIDNEVALLAAVGDALEDSGKAFFAASGTPTNAAGTATEDDPLDPDGPAGARARTASAVLGLADRGIRAGLVRMPRTVHGRGTATDSSRRSSASIGSSAWRRTSVTVRTGGRRCTSAMPRGSSARPSRTPPPVPSCTPSPRRASGCATSPR